MKTNPKSDAEILRQKAEEQLAKRKDAASNTSISEVKTLKLIQELQIHQIELEMQNEELVLAKEQAEHVNEKYINLYDFAPVGYITLSKENEIIALNFCAASMLCKERSLLMKNRFDLFISIETRPIFNSFFEKIIKNKTKETCEVSLIIGSELPIHAQLIGTFEEKSEVYLLTIIDITEKKLAYEELKLHREHLEELVRERTLKLEDKNKKLEEFNELFVNREFRINDLREEIKSLKK